MSPIKLPKVDLPRPPDPQLDPVGYLRSLGAVRERSKIVLDKAKRNELNHFDVDLTKMSDVVAFVSKLIKVSDEPFCSTHLRALASSSGVHLFGSDFRQGD